MNELRERCREGVEMILADDIWLSEVECGIVQRHLETFAKNERIKGMEIAKEKFLDIVYKESLHNPLKLACFFIEDMDAEIAKLKEGNS